MILFTLPKTNISHDSNEYHKAVELFIEEFNKPLLTNTSSEHISLCCKNAVDKLFGKDSGKFISISIDKIN